jgi:hypothetical protein
MAGQPPSRRPGAKVTVEQVGAKVTVEQVAVRRGDRWHGHTPRTLEPAGPVTAARLPSVTARSPHQPPAAIMRNWPQPQSDQKTAHFAA